MSPTVDRTSTRITAPPETLAVAPAGKWGDALLATALAAISILYLWPFRDALLLDPDEGIVLQGAARILHGQLPYRDFFPFYAPFPGLRKAAPFLGVYFLCAFTAYGFTLLSQARKPTVQQQTRRGLVRVLHKKE